MAGLNTFTVSIHGKEWVFDVGKAQNLRGNELGQTILEDIFPLTLRFIGLRDLLAPLEKDGAGKPVTI